MTSRVGEQFGNYCLTKFLGDGGFAEVYLGEHIHLGTLAAVKLLFASLKPDEVEQFRMEAKMIAELRHQNIVRLYEYDVKNGTPFLAMEYAPNGTLEQAPGVILSPQQILPYVQQVAAALQCAHDEEIVHRDVKPGNMLIGNKGIILLSDFGIALRASSTGPIIKQQALGTPAYVAPEHLDGYARSASDQYSLAIVVYEWLTGEVPFTGTPREVITKIRGMKPASLRSKISSISQEIDAVVLKALEKDRHDRFTSVTEFAKAFEQACTAPAVVILPVPQPKPVVSPPKPGSPILTYSGHEHHLMHIAWSPDGTRIASSDGGWGDSTVHVWDARNGNNILSFSLTYSNPSTSIGSLAWSPNGTRIASSNDGMVQVWDARSGDQLLTFVSQKDFVCSIAWSPDGKFIASGNQDFNEYSESTVEVWDARSGATLLTYSGYGVAKAVAWSPDGSRIASVGGPRESTVQVWNAQSGKIVGTYTGHAQPERYVFSLAWSPDGTRIASTSGTTNTLINGDAQIWDARNGSHILTYRGHKSNVCSVSWSPDGTRIASGSADNTVQVWDARTGMRLITFRNQYGLSVAWSPDGTRIASISDSYGKSSVEVFAIP